MDDVKIQSTSLDIEGLTEKEAREFKKILSKFIKSYSSKDIDVCLKDWLSTQFKDELPSLSDDECEKLSQETLDSIKEFDDNLKSVNEAASKGISKENWLADKIAAASVGVSINEYGNNLNYLSNTVSMANSQMMGVIYKNDGGIKGCLNLDGLIAEPMYVNSFNMEATLKNSPYRAELSPHTQNKNSFDVVIKDIAASDNRNIHQYQLKFGGDAKKTIQLIKSGNYDNQILVVPTGQVAEVQDAFPGKTVQDFIGGSEKVGIKSESFTKEQLKEMQLTIQKERIIPCTNWNAYNTKSLALNLGKQAGFMGLQAAALTVGFDMAAKVMSGEEIETDETIQLALESGVDAGVKAAVTGAMKVGVERGILSLIPMGTPVGVIANIACVTVENVKILSKLAKGELTIHESLNMMGKTTVSMVAGLTCGANGMIIGAAALSWIPIVGPIIGGVAGGMLGYILGSKVGETIYNVVKKIRETAKKVVVSTWDSIRTATSKVWDKVTSILPW